MRGPAIHLYSMCLLIFPAHTDLLNSKLDIIREYVDKISDKSSSLILILNFLAPYRAAHKGLDCTFCHYPAFVFFHVFGER